MATARTNTRCMLPPGWKNDVRARAIQAGLASGAPRSTMRSNFFCASARRCTVVVRAIEAAKRKCAGTSAKHACLIRARRLYRLLRVTCGAGPPLRICPVANLLTSIWALTFWICAACSFSWAVSACISLCC